jgi:polysaccharide chain length determinant protein (PEP-CTERM system associated)
MHDILVRILDDLHGSWRFRWLALAVAWFICIAGWFGVFLIPNTYESNARVYVDTQSLLGPLLEGLAVKPNVDSELAVVRQALLSRPRLEKVARDTDLDILANTPAQSAALILDLQKRIVISTDAHTPNSNSDGVYRITFQDTSREKSYQVVQTLLNSFVEDTLSGKREGQEEAQRFLSEQIAAHEKRLQDAESRLAEFKKRNIGRMPDDRGDYFARLQHEMVELERARQAVLLAEARRTEIERQLSGEEPFLFGFDDSSSSTRQQSNKGTGDVAARIRELEAREQQLLLTYTEKHPEVIALEDTLANLRRQQDEELERVRQGQRATGSLSQSLKSNPVYQGIRVDLNRTEIQLAELRKDLAQRQARVGDLQRVVNEVPEVEAELSRLNRDYDVTRTQYQELVKRLETARLTEDAAKTGVVTFQVIDPPAAAFEPVAPKRIILLIGVLLAGLGGGAGAAYLMNLLRPVFHNTRMLGEVLGLPVLGAISRAWAERDVVRRRLELAAVSSVGVLLVGAFVAVAFMSKMMNHAAVTTAGLGAPQ